MALRITHPNVAEDTVIPEHALASYAARGWLIVEQVPAGSRAEDAAALEQPGKNGSAPEWRTYAVASGDFTVAEAFDKTRDELVEHYHPTPSKPKAAPVAETPKES